MLVPRTCDPNVIIIGPPVCRYGSLKGLQVLHVHCRSLAALRRVGECGYRVEVDELEVRWGTGIPGLPAQHPLWSPLHLWSIPIPWSVQIRSSDAPPCMGSCRSNSGAAFDVGPLQSAAPLEYLESATVYLDTSIFGALQLIPGDYSDLACKRTCGCRRR